MEYRPLGCFGMLVPALSFGTETFYSSGRPGRTGNSDPGVARRMIDICLDAGLSMLDTATRYGCGGAENLFAMAPTGRRDQVLISTKAGVPTSPGPNDLGLSRFNLTRAIELLCAGWERITLTYSSCTLSTPPHPSRRVCPRSTTSSAPGRSGISGSRTSPAGS